MRQAKQGNGRALTRVGLREAVYNCRAGLSRAEASEICEAVIDEICAALAQGEPVQLRGFGSFNIRAKRGRIGRNPRTGVEAPITPRRVLTFKPSPFLVARLNRETVAGREEERECSKGSSAYAERLT
ncbi:integration host factor subunit alpha [Methylocystis suflitae]|uniref:integration host factor subunit alpha n=1 Tax=Methylocystis suflitae TaxID=2951405 RepID=UPI00210C5BF8|nr:integration host factor subunit alpha [Methylocystis suflitae]MCQ4189421.1 integration host factor subunit alpha [Methylocystis suflitae]